MTNDLVYLNGQYLRRHEATISPLDRGFLFGDAVYEVIPIYHQQMFLCQDHLTRLNLNLSRINMDWRLDQHLLKEIFETLIQDEFAPNICALYLQISRGTPDNLQRNHRYAKTTKPTIFAMLQARPERYLKDYLDGFTASLMPDLRWHCTHIKATSLLANVMHIENAKSNNAQEAILHYNNHLTEGASSNVFFVTQGILYTPSTEENILPGVTRKHIINLAKTLKIPSRIQACPLDLLLQASEVMITSSTREIMPIVAIDEHRVADGKPGRIFKQLFDAYKAALPQPRHETIA